ncbi:PREDICTED: uncharacterized protein LOC105964420 [Erythranthe guttata]|uniref:uncharacterized protein LOC105964420 n=1 Tax=Erythranthe guttata TaxID=4155 RepID=UPI00064DA6B0|nr:PREDICTED: uncharacterized protein LOC105964420 [Erythranthe guttata]|eukprot:XP_012844383.1 PREDICTED: uncharacterized protein LOC105964420 [Erythranthe guttata]
MAWYIVCQSQNALRWTEIVCWEKNIERTNFSPETNWFLYDEPNGVNVENSTQRDVDIDRDLDHNAENEVDDNSDCDSWMAEDFEGPNDDDIFVERPEDHAHQELKRMRVVMQESAQKTNAQTYDIDQLGSSNEQDWYSDVESDSDSDLENLKGSDHEGDGYELWKEKNYPNMNEFEMKIGMKFANRAIFREVLRDWVVRNGWDLSFKKCERHKITAICKKGCNWKIHASSVMKTLVFQVKSIKGSHKCARTMDNKQATYKYIGKRIVDVVRDNPCESLETLKRKIWRDIQVDCSLHIVCRARRYALVLIKGNVKREYERLWDYCATVCNENKESTLQLKLDRSVNPPALIRMYYSLGGLKSGFKIGCRPIIGLDGCFLKGPFKGHLLSAIGRDANDNIYPIAMAFVEIEKYDSWRWFLEILLRDIGPYEERGWAFISDRQKGLIEAVSELFPHAEHRYCLRHMYNNFKLKFKGINMRDLFWSAASTANVNEHYQIMKAIDDKYPITVENEVTPYVWLSRIPAHHWARSHFSTRTKCNVLVNNLSESFNSYILEVPRSNIYVVPPRCSLRPGNNALPSVAAKENVFKAACCSSSNLPPDQNQPEVVDFAFD